MTKVYLMIYDMGGGHRATAEAVQKVIEQQNLGWQVRIVEVFEEIFRTQLPQYIYNNLILKQKWMQFINTPLLIPWFKLQLRLRHQSLLKLLRKYWHQHQPDLVVSLIPCINRALSVSLRLELPNTPFVTAMTDFADSPPNFWIEPQEQFIICPSEKAVKQAQSIGYAENQIFHTSGIIIHPRFYQFVAVDRRTERQRLGLDPDLLTGLVLFGGHGSNVMMKIATYLEQSHLNLQLIFLCGRNKKLANSLRLSQSCLPRFVETFTHQIPYYMYLSDFLIGKPGPGSLSEALAMNLPVITESNAYTLLQESYNIEWIMDKEVGIVISNFRNVERAVAKLIQPENYSRYRVNASTINNRAVFEIPDILQKILAT